jgi:Fur family ferric uptake transcriptional regulator
VIEQLTTAGYKVTGPRKRVLKALRAAAAPQTAQEVADAAGTSVASTYRVLALLVELGAVSEVDDCCEPGCCPDNRARRYALCSAQGHHHHFVCRSCHATLEVTCEELERAVKEIERTTGLRVEQHDVTLRGQCLRCQEEERA